MLRLLILTFLVAPMWEAPALASPSVPAPVPVIENLNVDESTAYRRGYRRYNRRQYRRACRAYRHYERRCSYRPYRRACTQSRYYYHRRWYRRTCRY